MSEIVVTIHFVDGDSFVQPLTIEDADAVQDFMNWFRNPGRDKVWAWHVVEHRQIHMMHHDKIMAVDIDGFIEPEGRPSRWYERFFDKIKIWRIKT
ncbi:hypothetical protein [Paenibacillus naphthalenovorans]|uniref:hypothetical protein n=1 Tax=Paenibacillus naphthalenovorans TaxID=162209 RepID=UPI003D2C3130